jgi:hypothetical protein
MPQHEQNISLMSEHPMQQTRTTDWGELPVIEAWRNCKPTRYGWKGTRPDGTLVEVRSRQGRAELPDQDYILNITDGGKVVGVIALDHPLPPKPRKRASTRDQKPA